MLRSRLYILAIVVVAIIWGAGAVVSTMDPGLTNVTVSTRLTDQEADCIVGGQVGCWEESKSSYEECLKANLNPMDPKTAVAYIDCAAVGAWTGIACALTWIWGLFF